jgi:hypothetical protein
MKFNKTEYQNLIYFMKNPSVFHSSVTDNENKRWLVMYKNKSNYLCRGIRKIRITKKLLKEIQEDK